MPYMCNFIQTSMMAMLTTSCLLLLAASGVLGTPTIDDASVATEHAGTLDRLATIEASLESVIRKNNEQEKIVKDVLKKNEELETRVEVLESENELLKKMVSAVRDTGDNHYVQWSGVEVKGNFDADDTDQGTMDDGKSTMDDEHEQVGDTSLQSEGVKRHRRIVASDVFVGFTATVSKVNIQHLGQAQTLIYDHAITNVGNGYHTHTGIFIAPVSGVYAFNFDTMLEPGDYEHLELVLDGISTVYSLGVAIGEAHYVTTSRTIVLQVNKGSEVWVRTTSGTGTIHGEKYSSFSGWLLAVVP